MTEFQRAYCRALGQEITEPVPIEPDPELERLAAEEVNARIREIEDEHFQIYAPTNNQRRVLYADTRYGGDCSL